MLSSPKNHQQTFFQASEAVAQGHPDKICDQISDLILDYCLKLSPLAKVACEVLACGNKIIVAGEISNVKINFVAIEDRIWNFLRNELLYTNADLKNLTIENLIQQQSLELANMYTKTKLLTNQQIRNEPTADQGVVIGFACQEYDQDHQMINTNLLPLSYVVSQALMQQIKIVHTNQHSPLAKLLAPDAKALVVISYTKQLIKKAQHHSFTGMRVNQLDQIVLSAQHQECQLANFCQLLKTEIVQPVCQQFNLPCPSETNLFFNHAGAFQKGGFSADTGLTGRKIVVDSYGPTVRVGGGCFSGKDPSKIDRSGAYLARYIAKHIVTAELCERCEIEISYCINSKDCLSFSINTFNTAVCDETILHHTIQKLFSFQLVDIINRFNLCCFNNPDWNYHQTAYFGAFLNPKYPWEQIDSAIIEQLRQLYVKR